MTNIDSVGAALGSGGAGGKAAKPKCENPTVELEVQKNLLTLKHDRTNRVKILIKPTACKATEFKIEIQRASGGGWFLLSNKRSFLWSARVAGKFQLRGTAKIDGTDYQTALKDVEVQFPNYGDIVGDSRVRVMTNREWARTLKACTQNPNVRRELGFWIQINTKSNRYISTDRTKGPLVPPTDGAYVDVPARPADNPSAPDPNAKGVKYPVASFHTHTPTTYRAGGGARGIGPSGADNRIDTKDQVPGVVYDYVESPVGSGSIPMGHPELSAAILYKSLGLDRRPTP
jgi:hypothetical protein